LLLQHQTLPRWSIADTFNAAMCVPNLIALLLLSGVVAKETKDFKEIRRKEKVAKREKVTA
jgi:AGCS family alanine or glycine:cation symporter